MLTIRFARIGKKNKPYYRIVLQEKSIAPGGRHVEVLGSYDPHLKKAIFKEEKIKSWIEKGVQMSDTVYNLFVSNGLVLGEKRKVKIPKKIEEEKKEEIAENATEVKEDAEDVTGEKQEIKERNVEKTKSETEKKEKE